jgi:hypothetical protein
VASDGTTTGVYAGDKSAFSIHCYRTNLQERSGDFYGGIGLAKLIEKATSRLCAG